MNSEAGLLVSIFEEGSERVVVWQRFKCLVGGHRGMNRAHIFRSLPQGGLISI